METKICSVCNKEKDLSEFSVRSDVLSGRRASCIDCMKEKRICGIYCIENKTDNKKYVGYSSDLKHRQQDHRAHLRKGDHANEYLQNAWNKYGEENFIFYIIEECTCEELKNKEMFYIKNLNTKRPFGYNLSDGGNGGLNPSEETRMKMSKAQKGKVFTEEYRKNLSIHHAHGSPMLGKHHTEEAKRKSSVSKMGDKNPMYGKHFSEESRKKLSDALSGPNHPNFKSKEVVEKIKEMLDAGFLQREIKDVMGVSLGLISKVKKGGYKDVYGI